MTKITCPKFRRRAPRAQRDLLSRMDSENANWGQAKYRRQSSRPAPFGCLKRRDHRALALKCLKNVWSGSTQPPGFIWPLERLIYARVLRLFGLVKDRLELEILERVCICNRSRNRIKLLFWMAPGCGFAANAWRGFVSNGRLTAMVRCVCGSVKRSGPYYWEG